MAFQFPTQQNTVYTYGIDQTCLVNVTPKNVLNNVYTFTFQTQAETLINSFILEFDLTYGLAYSQNNQVSKLNYSQYCAPSFTFLQNIGNIYIQIGESNHSVEETTFHQDLTYYRFYRQTKLRNLNDEIIISRYGLRETNTQATNFINSNNLLDDNLLSLNPSGLYFENTIEYILNTISKLQGPNETTCVKHISVPLSELDPFFDNNSSIPTNTRITIKIELGNVVGKTDYLYNSNISLYQIPDNISNVNLQYKKLIIEEQYKFDIMERHFNTFRYKAWKIPFIKPYKLKYTIDIMYYKPVELYLFLTTQEDAQDSTISNVYYDLPNNPKTLYLKYPKYPMFGIYVDKISVNYKNNIREPLQILSDQNINEYETSDTYGMINNINSTQNLNNIKDGHDFIQQTPFCLNRYIPYTINLANYSRDVGTLNTPVYLQVEMICNQQTNFDFTQPGIGVLDLVIMLKYSQKFIINNKGSVRLDTQSFSN